MIYFNVNFLKNRRSWGLSVACSTPTSNSGCFPCELQIPCWQTYRHDMLFESDCPRKFHDGYIISKVCRRILRVHLRIACLYKYLLQYSYQIILLGQKRVAIFLLSNNFIFLNLLHFIKWYLDKQILKFNPFFAKR